MAKGTVNKTIILGRLGQDPESKTTAGGMTVVRLNVATNELGKKDPNTGKYEGATTWHRCVLFDKTAEAAATYLKKGSNVYLEGRIENQKYQDKDGKDCYSTSIICHDMQFIGGKDDGQSNQSNAQVLKQSQQGFNQQSQQNRQGQQSFNQNNQGQQGFNQPQQNQVNQNQNNGFDNFDPDIPF